MARLFLAVWPDADVRFRLARARDAWSWPADARPVPDARLHLTLHFIGSFPHDGIEALADRLAAVAPRRMMLRADRPEVWRGGLAVLRIAPEAGVRGLHEDLGAVLSELAVPLDTRPFTPHVTLARKAAGARPPDSAPELDWSADGFALVDSITGTNAVYRVVRSFPTEG